MKKPVRKMSGKRPAEVRKMSGKCPAKVRRMHVDPFTLLPPELQALVRARGDAGKRGESVPAFLTTEQALTLERYYSNNAARVARIEKAEEENRIRKARATGTASTKANGEKVKAVILELWQEAKRRHPSFGYDGLLRVTSEEAARLYPNIRGFSPRNIKRRTQGKN